MGVRETLDRSPGIAAAAVGGLIVASAVVAWSQFGGPSGSAGPGRAYFTVDDGKTTFVDSAAKPTPFDHDGKPAVRAVVFTCGANGGGEKFVGYLERAGTGGSPGRPGRPASEIRRPGDAKWVPRFSPEGGTILTVRCPGNAAMQPREVVP